MGMSAKVDVAVIGGGVIGCAVAYYLTKQGARVTVINGRLTPVLEGVP